MITNIQKIDYQNGHFCQKIILYLSKKNDVMKKKIDAFFLSKRK